MITKEQGEDKAETASDKVVYKIDVPANRWVCMACIYQKAENS